MIEAGPGRLGVGDDPSRHEGAKDIEGPREVRG